MTATREYDELLKVLRALRVVQVISVVAKPEDIFSFRDKEGMLHWDDEPDFEKSLKKLSQKDFDDDEAGVSYRHYFGFTYPSRASRDSNHSGCRPDTKTDRYGQIYFQQTDHSPMSLFGFYQNQCDGGAVRPPRKDKWIAGEIKLVLGKGLRFKKWCIITPLEAEIHRCLIEGKKLTEDQISTSVVNAGDTDSLSCEKNGNIVSFARLIVNEQIDYYLDLKRRSSASEDAATSEKYMYRQAVDVLVFQTVHNLRPDLWEEYKEISSCEKLYSGMIPKPAPLKIEDDLTGAKKKVGLYTPFAGLELKS